MMTAANVMPAARPSPSFVRGGGAASGSRLAILINRAAPCLACDSPRLPCAWQPALPWHPSNLELLFQSGGGGRTKTTKAAPFLSQSLSKSSSLPLSRLRRVHSLIPIPRRNPLLPDFVTSPRPPRCRVRRHRLPSLEFRGGSAHWTRRCRIVFSRLPYHRNSWPVGAFCLRPLA